SGSLTSVTTNTEGSCRGLRVGLRRWRKRSHRRIRDLVALPAFQGLDANEIGCARISMMAKEQKRSVQWAEYRCARPIISRSSNPACTARPVHTEVPIASLRAAGKRLFDHLVGAG